MMTTKPSLRWLPAALLAAGLTGGTLSWAADEKPAPVPVPIPAAAPTAPKAAPTGYTDTPVLPGQTWKVHDEARPRPAVVTPAEAFSQGAKAPSDAVILFDGKDLSQWKDQKTGGPAGWKVENGYMEVAPKTGTIQSIPEFGDFQLHLEFATPKEIVGNSQGRGNSGVIIYGKYEIQVLDSYENKTYADGQAGAMYGQFPPLRNAVKKPGEWQSYDIIFETARWNDKDELIKPARVTVILNGVVVQHGKEFIGAVAHRNVGKYTKHEPKGPLVLQDHGNPMRFRNIWVRELGSYDEPEKK